MANLKNWFKENALGNTIIAIIVSVVLLNLEPIFKFSNMFLTGWSFASKLIANQFRDYIIFPLEYSQSQPSFLFLCFASISLFLCAVCFISVIKFLRAKKTNKTLFAEIFDKHCSDLRVEIMGFLFFFVISLYCGYTLSTTYYANNLYEDYCVADLIVQDKKPADSVRFKIRLSKVKTIEEIRSIIDEMTSETEISK